MGTEKGRKQGEGLKGEEKRRGGGLKGEETGRGWRLQGMGRGLESEGMVMKWKTGGEESEKGREQCTEKGRVNKVGKD